MSKPRVFVSHTIQDERDRSLAAYIARGLRLRGVTAWIAPDSIPAGEEWREEIDREIKVESTHFVVILSATSVASDWVLTEIDLAAERVREDRHYRVLPLVTGRLPDYRCRGFISLFQTVPWHDDAASQLTPIPFS